MIKANNLTKSFGPVRALDDMSLHVDKGAVYGLIGANGSGKTTLIKHLAGIMVPDSGSCEIGGEPVLDNIDQKKQLGYVADDLYFFGNYWYHNPYMED